MAPLDLRSINLGDKDILTFETKNEAKKHHLPYLCYITQAANRFWLFWVIVRKFQTGEFQIMRKDGSFMDCECRRLCGNVSYISEHWEGAKR